MSNQPLELIDGGRDFERYWGEEIVDTKLPSPVYFPLPLSYPFRFSEDGIGDLVSKLKQHPSVDPGSVQIAAFPNIPARYQYEFRSARLGELLVDEPYVRFKLHGWHDITFMRFPTFLVELADHTKKGVASISDYEMIAQSWRDRVDRLKNLTSLTQLLGIERTGQPWMSIPILTFISFDKFQGDPSYFNRYLMSPEGRNLFLREVSLRAAGKQIPKDADFWTGLLGCNEIQFEVDSISVWRLFYVADPLFYDGPNWHIHTSTHSTLSRILRSALFVNLTLPYAAGELRASVVILRERLQHAMRDCLAHGSMSLRHIDRGEAELIDWQEEILPAEARLDEMRNWLGALSRLRIFIANPFSRPLDHSEPTSEAGTSRTNPCNELFDFGVKPNVLNDRRKAVRYENEIKQLLVSAEQMIERSRDYIQQRTGWLQHRRGMVEAQRVTAMSIVFPALGAAALLTLGEFWRRRKNPAGGGTPDNWTEPLRILLPLWGGAIFGLLWIAWLHFW